MECETFRKLYNKYYGATRITLTDETEEYAVHFHDCRSCGDWAMGKIAQEQGQNLDDHPCVHLAYRVCRDPSSGLDPNEDPDVTLIRTSSGNYGIPVRDGGSSYIAIDFCPWCGIKIDN